MNISQNPGDADNLEALSRPARHHAAHMMRTTGNVPPTVIAGTGGDLIFPNISSELS